MRARLRSLDEGEKRQFREAAKAGRLAKALDLQLKAPEKLQLEEMKATRDEMQRQAKASEQQVEALDAQRRATLLSSDWWNGGLAEGRRIAPNTINDTTTLEGLRNLVNAAFMAIERKPLAEPLPLPLPPPIR